jgi:hypothetical protein
MRWKERIEDWMTHGDPPGFGVNAEPDNEREEDVPLVAEAPTSGVLGSDAVPAT